MIRLLLEARDPETGDALDHEALRNEAAVLFWPGGDDRQFAGLDLVSAVAGARGRSAAACRAGGGARRPPADPGGLAAASSIRARYTRRRCAFTRRCRCSAGRRLREESIRNRAIPAGSLLVVVRGCCTAIGSCGTSRTISSRIGSCRRTRRRGSATAISRSASGRGSAPARRSALPRRSCASRPWRSGRGCFWRRAPWSSRSAG